MTGSLPPANSPAGSGRPARFGLTATSARLAVFGGALAALVLSAAGVVIWQARQSALIEAGQGLTNLTRALAEHTSSTVRSLDLVLRSTADWAGTLKPGDRADTQALYRLLVARAAGVPQVRTLGIFGPDGRIWLSSRSYPAPDLNIADDPHFAVHRDAPDAGLHIAIPRKSKLEGRPSLFFSRGIRGADGRFEGVVVALVDPGYFEDFYSRIELGESGVVGLFHSDGYVLARHPDGAAWLGRDVREGEIYRRAISKDGSAFAPVARMLDERPRLYSTVRLRDFPLVLAVGQGEEAALLQWRASSWRLGGAAIFAAAAILLLVGAMTRQIRRREALGIELRRSEARYRELVESAHSLILEVDLSGRVRYCNDYAERFFGFGRDEMVGRHVTETIVPVTASTGEDLRPMIEGVLASPDNYAVKENENVCRDGRRVWIRWANRSIRNAAGEVTGVLSVGTDITDRKQAETALKRTQAAFDNSMDPIYWVGSGAQILYVNEAACRTLGYSREELMAMSIFDIDPLFPRDKWAEHWRRSVARKAYVIETEHRARDGRVFPVEIAITRIQDASGEYHHAVARDITERKRAEEALRRFKTTLDLTQDCVFMFEPQTLKFFYVNRGAMEQIGYTAEELLQMTPVDIKPDFDEPGFRAMIAPMLTGERDAISFETVHRHRDGRDIQVEIMLQYVAPAGEAPRFVAVVRDITERKRAEEALRRLNTELEQRVAERTGELAASNAQLQETLATLQRAQQELVRSEKLAGLGSLVAGVAHELSTPLGNSLTVATTLAEKTRDFAREMEGESLRRSTLNAYVEQAGHASDLLTRSLLQASELINDFKQVAVDQASAQRREFELDEVVADVVGTLQPQFRGTTHRVELDLPPGVRMDSFPGPLGQVVSNLVTNALVHAFEGRDGGVVRIEGERTDGSVRLRVKDNGSGIAPEHMPRIFDPFFTTRMGRGGSGLGLHIVYSIVTRMLGGRVEATSTPGAGACFTIDLPLTAPTQPAGQPWESVGAGGGQIAAE